MSTQIKSKLYVLIIGLLLLSNIALLFFFLGNKKDNRHGGRSEREAKMAIFLKNEIGFSTLQIKQYDSLHQQHKEKMKADFDAMKMSKEQQFKELGSQGFSDSAIADIVTKNTDKQKQMELNMLQHFAAIRKICTAGQVAKFDSVFYKIWDKKKK